MITPNTLAQVSAEADTSSEEVSVRPVKRPAAGSNPARFERREGNLSGLVIPAQSVRFGRLSTGTGGVSCAAVRDGLRPHARLGSAR